MGAHDHVAEAGGDEALEGDEFTVGPSGRDVDEAQVSVAGSAAVAGKMFQAGQHAVGAVGADVVGGVARDGLGIGGKAAALALDDRIVGVSVEVNDRGEVEVEADAREGLCDSGGVAGGGRGIVDPTEFLVGAARGETVDSFEAIHPSALLIDRGEERDAGV